MDQLPAEILSCIADLVADGYSSDSNYDPYNEDEVKSIGGSRSSGLSIQDSKFASYSEVDLENLRNLRLVSKTFSDICTPLLFRIVRVVPSEESAARYTNILKNDLLNKHVNKIIFQTRHNPDSGNVVWDQPEPGDEYTEPHEYFLEIMDEVGRFINLTNVELVFASACDNGEAWGDVPESIEYRIEILERFFSGLAHKDHPADKIYHLSLKNLQDMTPKAIMSEKDSDFKRDFEYIMSRLSHLSMQIATEYDSAAPENTLEIQECHDFFGYELNRYWLDPIRNNLTYLKLHATEMFWGYYPTSNLPKFPKLRTLSLGNVSFAHDKQVDWIVSHASTLEELVLDDCLIAVGGKVFEQQIDSQGQMTYILDCGRDPDDENGGVEEDSEDEQENQERRVHFRAKGVDYREQTWLYGKRWHDYFHRFREELPHLNHFVIGHGPWSKHAAFDQADTLLPAIRLDRYQFFDAGTGPSPWLAIEDHISEPIFNSWDEEEKQVRHPDCEEEDLNALNELYDELRRRKRYV